MGCKLPLKRHCSQIGRAPNAQAPRNEQHKNIGSQCTNKHAAQGSFFVLSIMFEVSILFRLASKNGLRLRLFKKYHIGAMKRADF